MYTASENGWMEEAIFYQWLSKMFVPHINRIRTKNNLDQQTAILYFDGHSSHISLRIVELAMAHNIQLVKFPSHMTDKLQPLDVCVFGPIKTAWERALVEYGKGQIGKGCTRLPKSKFGELLAGVWDRISKESIKSGFRSTGLFPLNKTKVRASWFNPDALDRFNRYQHSQGQGDSTISGSSQLTSVPLVLDRCPKVTNIIQVFSADLARSAELAGQSISSTVPERRLKHHTLGEVLASPEVAERLGQTEEVRRAKKRPAASKKMVAKNK